MPIPCTGGECAWRASLRVYGATPMVGHLSRSRVSTGDRQRLLRELLVPSATVTITKSESVSSAVTVPIRIPYQHLLFRFTYDN